MNTLRNLWAKLTANGCKSDCQQGDRPCPTPELCYPALHQHNGGASVDTEDAPPFTAEGTGGMFVWFLVAAAPLVVVALWSLASWLMENWL
jgi:hypothetical protein